MYFINESGVHFVPVILFYNKDSHYIHTAVMKTYDVLIVGAGPAGTVAGYHLAQAGFKVLILEKALFPRRKVCGGALTQKALDELPFDITPVIHRAVDWGYLGFQGQTICAIHADSPIAYLVDRSTFDHFLLGKAIEQGVECVQQAKAIQITQTDTGITVQTPETSVQGRFLIGADGVHSLVARQSGIRKPSPTSLCYEARLALPENTSQDFLDSITFDFGTLWWGYGWIFPKRDHLNVGVFRNWPGRKTSRKHLSRFIRQHPGLRIASILDVRAFPGPLGGKSGPFHKGRCLLIGDAAGLADPWLGEGIYYALASGRMAAESILQQENSDMPDLSSYSHHIQKKIIHQFRYAKRLAFLANLFYRVNVNLLKESGTLQQMMIDLLTGQRSYTRLWHDLWSSFPQLINRVFR